MAHYDLSPQKIIHRDLKPGNIGLYFQGVSNAVFVDEKNAADFLKNFDFVRSKGTFKVKFFDLGLSETVDEHGFGSTEQSGTLFTAHPNNCEEVSKVKIQTLGLWVAYFTSC